MKVILLEDVKKQGKKGDVLNVKDGYGTYLITNNLAVKKTEGSTFVLNKQNEAKKQKEEKELKEAIELKEQLEKIKLIFKVKTGNDGRVFGTISTKQIVNKLNEKGFNIDKKRVLIQTSINTLGTTIVKINLHKQVVAELKIELQK